MLDKDVNINSCKTDGASPLFVACLTGQQSTVKLLLDIGSDANICWENSVSPLYMACQNCSISA